MENELIGKVLKNEKDEEFKVIKVLSYKGINCCYCEKVSSSNKDKSFLQLSGDKDSLVSITSKKVNKALMDYLIDEEKNEDARKIKEGESVADYLAYLDDYYKTKIVSNL